MKCPRCSSRTKVENTRNAYGDRGRRRTRTCQECGYAFKSVEMVEMEGLDHLALLSAPCHNCGKTALLFSNSRARDGISTQRIYKCQACSQETHTVESAGVGMRDALALYGPTVVKRSGSRVPYDRDELLRGLTHVRDKQLDEAKFKRLIEHVEKGLRLGGAVTTAEIEESVLDFLKIESFVSYIRYLIDLGRVPDMEKLRKLMEEMDE